MPDTTTGYGRLTTISSFFLPKSALVGDLVLVYHWSHIVRITVTAVWYGTHAVPPQYPPAECRATLGNGQESGLSVQNGWFEVCCPAVE